jgi:hypothetical protein
MKRIEDLFFVVYWPVSRAVGRVWRGNWNPTRHRLPPGPPVTADDPIWDIVGDIQRWEESDKAASDQPEDVAHV